MQVQFCFLNDCWGGEYKQDVEHPSYTVYCTYRSFVNFCCRKCASVSIGCCVKGSTAATSFSFESFVPRRHDGLLSLFSTRDWCRRYWSSQEISLWFCGEEKTLAVAIILVHFFAGLASHDEATGTLLETVGVVFLA